jgi:hypothetical protein
MTRASQRLGCTSLASALERVKLEFVLVTLGPRERSSKDLEPLEMVEALRTALGKSKAVLDGTVRVVAVDASLTVSLEVQARDPDHGLNIASDLYRDALFEVTQRTPKFTAKIG